MRTSKHGRSAHGDSDLGEGQAIEPQIRATARTAPHLACRFRPAGPPTNQSGSRSTRYTSPTGKTIPLEAKLERTPEQEAANEALAKLVRQCMAGDSQAWQQLVVSQHRRIYAICYRFTGSGTDAEDLTQDVFLKLYKNLASFDTQKGSFQTWITTLARNLLVDHFRRTRLDRASDSLDATFDGEEDGPTMADRLADPRPSQEQHVAGLELKVRVQSALKQLSPSFAKRLFFAIWKIWITKRYRRFSASPKER